MGLRLNWRWEWNENKTNLAAMTATESLTYLTCCCRTLSGIAAGFLIHWLTRILGAAKTPLI